MDYTSFVCGRVFWFSRWQAWTMVWFRRDACAIRIIRGNCRAKGKRILQAASYQIFASFVLLGKTARIRRFLLAVVKRRPFRFGDKFPADAQPPANVEGLAQHRRCR